MVALDLRTLLPKTRAAFDAGQLQAQKSEVQGSCKYAGPCAIGVGLEPADQLLLDGSIENTSIESWIRRGAVEVPEDQRHDIQRLQSRHDGWATEKSPSFRDSDRVVFEDFLIELEAKWPPVA